MLRIISTAAIVSVVLVIAAPRARSAIAELHAEIAAVDALDASAAAAPRPAHQQPHWVAVADYDAALARVQSDK